MKKKFIVSYRVVSGGGSQEIELDIPEGAYDIKIEPITANIVNCGAGNIIIGSGSIVEGDRLVVPRDIKTELKTKTCMKCGKLFVTSITRYKSNNATLTIGDNGSADSRIANVCDECKSKVSKEIHDI